MAGNGILEKDIQKSILEWMRYQKKCFVWRQNSGGAYRSYKGKSNFYKYQDVDGVSDIIGVWEGIPLAIEVKRPGEKATPLQRSFLEYYAKAGGISIVAHSLEELQSSIKYVFTNYDRTSGTGYFIENL